jgi:2-desacetyl-2-hydroxyethyl bacteriochlorophyllide A dehydrogenase
VTSRAVWIVAPEQIEVRSAPSVEPGRGQVRMRTQCCGISAGSELIAYKGALPANADRDEEIDPHAPASTYPQQTGYSSVGVIESVGVDVSRELLGRRAFAFHPHASRVVVAAKDIVFLPDDVSDELGTLIPNLETALGIVMDANPSIGERVVVFGQGVVGLLVTRLLSLFPLEQLIALDPLESRRNAGLNVGAHAVFDPSGEGELAGLHQTLSTDKERFGADLILELSGNPDALNLAIDLAGFGSRIVAGSWYGSKTAALDLGGRFHRNRIRILSSQVSTLGPELTGRWTKQRRMDHVLRLLQQLDLHTLITHRFPLENAAEAYELLASRREDTLHVVLKCVDDSGIGEKT